MRIGTNFGRALALAATGIAAVAATSCSSQSAESVSDSVAGPASSATEVPPTSMAVAPTQASPSSSPSVSTKSPKASSSPSSTQSTKQAPATATTSAAAKPKKTKAAKAQPTSAASAVAPIKINPQLTVSKTTGLSPGSQVTVRGTGFDTSKGIYVAFCVKPRSGAAPGPCGGGADTDGDSAASEWISSNPPPYGKNLVVPYGANGSFTVTIRVSESIGGVDCTVEQCVIASRADHTRSSDRSQDVLIPIRFG